MKFADCVLYCRMNSSIIKYMYFIKGLTDSLSMVPGFRLLINGCGVHPLTCPAVQSMLFNHRDTMGEHGTDDEGTPYKTSAGIIPAARARRLEVLFQLHGRHLQVLQGRQLEVLFQLHRRHQVHLQVFR